MPNFLLNIQAQKIVQDFLGQVVSDVQTEPIRKETLDLRE